MRSLLWLKLWGIAGFGLLTACVAAPVQEMSDARQAVEAAAQAGGEQKAPEQMQAAREALATAEKAVRNVQFKQAREQAIKARDLAFQAQRFSQTQ